MNLNDLPLNCHNPKPDLVKSNELFLIWSFAPSRCHSDKTSVKTSIKTGVKASTKATPEAQPVPF